MTQSKEAKCTVPTEVMETINEPYKIAKDKNGNRWCKCSICGKVDIVDNFAIYGGEHLNRGKCIECIKQQGNNMIYID